MVSEKPKLAFSEYCPRCGRKVQGFLDNQESVERRHYEEVHPRVAYRPMFRDYSIHRVMMPPVRGFSEAQKRAMR